MASNAEGKTTTASCESCEEDTASLFCQQCKMSLCSRCGKGHTKQPFARDHTVKVISKGASSEGSASGSDDIHCTMHTTTNATMICNDCSEMACPSCASTHSSHKTILLTTDVKALQDVNIRGLQGMISDFHELGQRKGAIDGHSLLYADAVKKINVKRSEIHDIVDKYADLLEKDTLTKKSQVNSKLKPTLGGVTDQLASTDKHISMLNSTKSSTHRNVLLRGIKNTFVMKKLNEEVMDATKKYSDIPTIEKLLPGIERTEDVKSLMKSMFRMGKGGCNPIVDFAKFRFVDEGSVDRGNWRLCDGSVTGYSDFVLFYYDGAKILIHDTSLVKARTKNCDKTISHLAKVDNDRYVGTYSQSVYLLDGNFKHLKTKNDQYDDLSYSTKTICSNGINSVIECCISNTPLIKLHVNEVTIRNNEFHSTNILTFDVSRNEGYNYLFCRKRDNILVIAQHKEAYSVDLGTRAVKTHDISSYMTGEVSSICLDIPGYILIGDESAVHVFNESWQHITQIDGGIVNGIAFANDNLYVSVNKGMRFGTKLKRYQQ